MKKKVFVNLLKTFGYVLTEHMRGSMFDYERGHNTELSWSRK